MLLIVMGAGASYDSSPRHASGRMEARPPLANELFESRSVFAEAINLFPDFHPILPRLHSPPEGMSVEKVLEEYQGEAARDARRHAQLASIKYYLGYIIRACETNWRGVTQGVTNYKSLLDEAESRLPESQRIAIATFNYDTMVEDAIIAMTRRSRPSIEAYTSWDRYALFKLHGSVDWGRIVESPIIATAKNGGPALDVARELIRCAAELKISRRYIRSEGPIVSIDRTSGFPLFPAIAVPFETKRDYECPDEHIKQLNGLLPTVTKLLIVGWRGLDTHFVEALARGIRADTPAMVVNGGIEHARQTAALLERGGVRASFLPIELGLSDFIRRRDILKLLM